MALTIDGLQELMKAEDFAYFVHPQMPTLKTGAKGLNGTYEFVVSLEQDGEFLQFRTLRYLYCETDNPHLETALRVIGHFNYSFRLAKWGWDPSDGEIDVCADVWVKDGTLTKAQFHQVMWNYLTAIDVNYPRLKNAVESGKDSGQTDPRKNLPDKLRELLERLARGAEEEEKEEDFATI